MDITCIFCQTVNPEDAYFCTSCENSLIVGKMTSNGTGIITKGFTWELRPRDHSLGRNMANDFVIPSNIIAGTHLKLLFSDDCFYVNDESGQNDVFINGDLVAGVTPLPSNCILQVGKEEFRYTFNLPEGASVKTTAPAAATPAAASPGAEAQPVAATEADIAGQLQLLLGIISEINTATSLQEALNHAVDSVLRITRTKRGYCFLIEETGEGTVELHEAAARQGGGEALSDDGSGEYTISQSMLTQVLSGNGSVMVEDAMAQHIDTKTIRKFKLKSIVCLPLVKRDDNDNTAVIGVVYADSVMPTGELPAHSRSTLQMLTEILSATILKWQDIERLQKAHTTILERISSVETETAEAMKALETVKERAEALQLSNDFIWDIDSVGNRVQAINGHLQGFQS